MVHCFDVNGSAGNGLPLSCVVNGIFIFSLYYKKPLKQRETTKIFLVFLCFEKAETRTKKESDMDIQRTDET